MAEPRFDVFLSHNSKDKPAVARIAEKLRRHQIEPWFDAWHLAPGKSFQDGIGAGLLASGACAVCLGPHGPGAWQKAELEVAQDRAVKDPAFQLFLVLLPGVPEPFDASVLPAFLNMRTWVDLRGRYEDPARFQPLLNAVAGVASGPIGPVELAAGVSPYRELQVFDEEHADFFFGREADVQRLLEKIKAFRFLAVVGPSGSGALRPTAGRRHAGACRPADSPHVHHGRPANRHDPRLTRERATTRLAAAFGMSEVRVLRRARPMYNPAHGAGCRPLPGESPGKPRDGGERVPPRPL